MIRFRQSRIRKAGVPERPEAAAARERLIELLGDTWAEAIELIAITEVEGKLVGVIGADIGARILSRIDRAAAETIDQIFSEAVRVGMSVAGSQSEVAGVLLDSQTLQRLADEWTQANRLEAIVNIAEPTKQVVRSNIREIANLRISPTEAERRIKNGLGLTPQGEASLRKFEADLRKKRRVLLEPGTFTDARGRSFTRTQAMVDRAEKALLEDVERKRKRLLQQRAELIVETEAQKAIQAGERRFWEELADERGLRRDDIGKVWITVLDDRVCPICEPMHENAHLPGEQQFQPIRFDQIFVSPTGRFSGVMPPAHPRCRCFIRYRLIEPQQATA